MDKNKILEDFRNYLNSMSTSEFFRVFKEEYGAKWEEDSEDKKQITMSYNSYLELQKNIDDMNVELEKRSNTIAELQEKVNRNIEQYVKDNNDAIIVTKTSVKKKLFDTETISQSLLSDERFISFVTGTNAFVNEDTSVEDKAKLLANILYNIAFEQEDFSYEYTSMNDSQNFDLIELKTIKNKI